MNNMLVIPLFLLIIVGSFSQLWYYDATDFSSSDNPYTQDINETQIQNGTEANLELEGASLNLDFGMTIGLIAVIAGAIALGLIGINVFGSGLSDFSVKIIWNGIVFYGLWSVFSVFAFNAIISIPLFGLMFWFILTVVYSLGVFGRMGL